MLPLQNNTRSFMHGKTQWKTGSSGDGYSGIIDLIRKANSVDLLTVFKQYGIELDEYNRQIRCPFKFHNDKSPSFVYYREKSGRFFCYGCKNHGSAVEFISLYEGISKTEAANKILSHYKNDLLDLEIYDPEHFKERQKLYLEFSTFIREFIQKNLNDPLAIEFVEKQTLIFDSLIERHPGIENKGLELIIKRIRESIEEF